MISPAIFSSDLASDVRHEYSVLLSIGKSNEEAEQLLISYYSDVLDCNDEDEPVFWFSLSRCLFRACPSARLRLDG